jgi:hypothetical protein
MLVAKWLHGGYGQPVATLTIPTDPGQAATTLIAAHDDDAWLDVFVTTLEGLRGARQLMRFQTRWGLTLAELGSCFGVSRQAVTKWMHAGVPADRADQLATFAAATDLLVRHLKADRIRAVVRRPAAILDGRSLVDLAMAGDSAAVLAATRSMFSFGDAHT